MSNIFLAGNNVTQPSFVELGRNICAAGSYGILATNHLNAYIHNNQVNTSGIDGISVFAGFYEIECNTVTGPANTGINLWNSLIRNDLSFNTVNGAGTGMRFSLECAGLDFIQCNTVQNTTGRGMLYNDARTGPQTNTGNSWINTGGAEFVQGIYAPNQSEYIVPDQLPWRPAPVNPPQGWFFPNMNLTPPPCPLVCQPGMLPPGGGTGNPLDTDIAGGGPVGDGWDQWRRERYLLYKLAAYPELAPSGSLMASFQSARAAAPVGVLVNLGLQTAAIFNLSAADQALVDANRQAIADKSGQMAALDAQIDETLDPETYNSLMAQRIALNTEVAGLSGQNAALLVQLQVIRSAQADNLIAQLGVLTGLQPWEQNERDVLTAMLQTLAKGQVPTEQQLTTLQAIGEQCPRIGGPAAVFLAALLYEGFTGTHLVQDECETAPRYNSTASAATTDPAVLTVTVYPNPVQDRMTLDIQGGQAPYTVQVVDMLGRPALDQAFESGQPALDTRSLAEGVYRLQVQDTNGAKQNRTIFVKH